MKKGSKMTAESRLKMSIARKEMYSKGLTPFWTGKKRPGISGNKHYNWKGSAAGENHRIRESTEYKLCRKACFERDNYTCIWCGQRGGKLNADHIKPFSLYPELRFALDNLRTLCESCHRTTDTYGCKLLINFKK